VTSWIPAPGVLEACKLSTGIDLEHELDPGG
jgi:hypothetical protein